VIITIIITGIIRELHLLPIRECVKFKLACLVRQSLSGQAPLYLSGDDCRLVSDSTRRSLRSADVSTCVVPPTLSSYGDRTFAAAGPRGASCVFLTSLTNCSDDSWRTPHEYGALWLLLCGAIEETLTYLLTYKRVLGSRASSSESELESSFSSCAANKPLGFLIVCILLETPRCLLNFVCRPSSVCG